MAFAHLSTWKQRSQVSRPLALVLSQVARVEQAALCWCSSLLEELMDWRHVDQLRCLLCISECLFSFIHKQILQNLYQTLMDSCCTVGMVNFNDKLKATCQVCTWYEHRQGLYIHVTLNLALLNYSTFDGKSPSVYMLVWLVDKALLDYRKAR